ncbi:hypothetical protein I7I48_11445 [Histoplasma ohiense]|nr:hypothetical protein I7I48_11445 [Histoplasma ohiense (nom. inval.)]
MRMNRSLYPENPSTPIAVHSTSAPAPPSANLTAAYPAPPSNPASPALQQLLAQQSAATPSTLHRSLHMKCGLSNRSMRMHVSKTKSNL